MSQLRGTENGREDSSSEELPSSSFARSGPQQQQQQHLVYPPYHLQASFSTTSPQLMFQQYLISTDPSLNAHCAMFDSASAPAAAPHNGEPLPHQPGGRGGVSFADVAHRGLPSNLPTTPHYPSSPPPSAAYQQQHQQQLQQQQQQQLQQQQQQQQLQQHQQQHQQQHHQQQHQQQPHHAYPQHHQQQQQQHHQQPQPPPVSQPQRYQYHEMVHEVDPDQLVNDVNPQGELPEPCSGSRYFVIKSYSEEDIHRAIKYSIWCSSKTNNDRLNEAYLSVQSKSPSAASSPVSTPSSSYGPDETGTTSGGGGRGTAFLQDHPMVYLFFSVNGSGHFCGVARLASGLNPSIDAGVWSQVGKWRGIFKIRWLYVKDVPNAHLRHIRLPNNDNKPVTNTRDGQEVLHEQGPKVLHVIHYFQYTTTLFDDYDHYDRLEEEKNKKKTGP